MKNSKKIIRIISIMFLVFMFLGMFSSIYAFEVKRDEVIKEKEVVSSPELNEQGGIILGIVSNVGIVVAVVAIMVMGIKFMLGSVEEKAQYKEHMKPYVIGVFMLFCIFAILRVIASLIKV